MNAAHRRRRRARLPVLLLLLAVLCFGVGVAVGEALRDNPKAGGSQTFVRTLTPVPLEPAAATTVTVTTERR